MTQLTQPAPMLSITILNYNYGRYLPECLDSILMQDFADFEIIIINDKSTDNSLNVIHPYLSDSRIRLIDHQVNQGYVTSLVEGMALSRGKYITVISADDYALDKTAFRAAIRRLEADSTIAFCFSAWNQVDDAGQVLHTRRAASDEYVAEGIDEFRRLILASPVLHSGTILRKSAYEAVGGYDTRCHYSVDTNMWLALCSVGSVAYINCPLYAYRTHETNLSNSKDSFWRATEEMLLGIDTAFARFSDAQLPDKATLQRHAKQRALVAIPTLDIFSGRRLRGWAGYWIACQHYPLLTIMQPRTLALVVRSLISEGHYQRLTSVLKRRRDTAAHITRAT